MKILLTKTAFIAFLLICTHSLKAQLSADFSITNPQGCTPLQSTFNDLSTGTTASTVYTWEFGNGNTSSLKNPSALFYTEGTYNVKLTIKEGNQSSSKTKTITVYKKPSPDFTFSGIKGCSPFQVTFNSTSTAGDGSITGYIWDFGDGTTQQTSSPSFTHIYQTEQKATVSLTAVNQYGCYNTITKTNIIDVLPSLVADFSVDQTVLCRISDAVQFTNKSQGPGTLTYLWNFGDGTTSTQKDPKHIFAQKGIYTIQLTVTSSEGCTTEKTIQNFVNVASFKTDFSISAPDVCAGSTLKFSSLSTPFPTQTTWQMGDGVSLNYNFAFDYRYNNTGDYNVTLINVFGNNCRDTAVKTIKVKPTPIVNGFLDSVMGKCGAPVEVRLRDTSRDAVKWEWWFNYSTNAGQYIGSSQNISTTITTHSAPEVGLIITNAEGCKGYAYKRIYALPPWVGIMATYSSGYNLNNACDSITMKFRTESQDTVIGYKWTFSDSTVSTSPTPQITFNKPGSHSVRLEYTTANGCKGTAYYTGITVYQKKKNDFTSLSGTKICGNNKVYFRSTPEDNYPYQTWYINGQYAGSSYYNNFDYQFQASGKYTIMMITRYGQCADTVIKTDYIEVVPPFAKIDRFLTICDGDRKSVRFFDGSRDVQSWTWNFGDGNTRTYSSSLPEITHNYASTGIYKVILAVTSGACTVKDSTIVTVYAKQSPKLTSLSTSQCADQPLTINISNIEPFPQDNNTVWTGTYLYRFEYNDGSPFQGTIDNYLYNYVLYPIPGTFTLRNFETGKSQLRLITRSTYNSVCTDTSNFIPIQINGAAPGFEIVTDNQCYQTPVVLRDTSKASGASAITSREWNFGDGKVETRTQGGTVTHLYENPGSYTVTLKVKDAAGCTSSFTNYARTVSVKGPKAAFSASSTNVPLNSIVYFFNNTNNYGTSGPVQYQWNFGNGATSTDTYPFYQYTVAGTYTVTLTATDLISGCTSTATQVITVRNFNTAFSFTTSFVTNASCPPVVARFSNTSVGYVKVSWDFGDGTTAGNVNYPSHVYTKPGKYIVKLLVFGDNGLKGTYIDSIFVKGQQASINFNPKETCSSQQVNFKASATGISGYLWDFGDGTFASTTDSISTHRYKAPGVYTPVLAGTDADGCTVAFPAADKIIIDSLSAKITGIPALACNEANIQFNADVYSVGATNNPGFLSYKWNFGTGNAADTSNVANPLFKFTSPGTYTVSLQVQAKSGCVKQVNETVTVYQSSKASINAVDSICTGGSVVFKGNATLTSGVQWSWNFKNGQQSSVQNPSAQLYTQPGSYPVTLIVNNNGCYDTATHVVTVSPLPAIQLSSTSLKICAGSTVQLSASGGQRYQWSPAASLNNAFISSPAASPSITTNYKVTVTTSAGCTSSDSLTIQVIQPFRITVQKTFFICEGETVQLSASGAASYRWIGNTQGLSSVNSGIVTAKPLNTISYTVVGFDSEGCFSDTAYINVTVHKRPSVNAGNDAEILPGTPYQITTTSSSDVVQWSWNPPDFLSCIQCASPVSTTNKTIEYIVTVRNIQGCSATDTIRLKTLCNGSQIFIPNSFTPNNDGLNDVFKILGNGASLVKLFVIYDRWGNKIFERKNMSADDPAAGWNGYYKGFLAPQGTYTYFVQLTCDATGETFERKGTVLLLQ
jgi:gliding motility-associated-like protein